MKKLGLVSLVTSALLFTGCGGGSNSEISITEQIAQRDGVLIIHNANLAFCETLKEFFTQNDSLAKDVITDSTDNSVNCSTYNKTEGDFDDESGECLNTELAYFLEDNGEDVSIYYIYEDTTKACVIGLNE